MCGSRKKIIGIEDLQKRFFILILRIDGNEGFHKLALRNWQTRSFSDIGKKGPSRVFKGQLATTALKNDRLTGS